MDLRANFGVDIDSAFLAWFNGEFADQFPRRFPGDEGITLVILDPSLTFSAQLNWHHPLMCSMIIAYIGEEKKHSKADGTLNNVEGKLQFCLRTGQDSIMAEEEMQHLLLPGDFPWQGAGYHRDYVGGVSGLDKEDDWAVFCECVDKYISIRSNIVEEALQRSRRIRQDNNQPQGVRDRAKYLRGLNLSDTFPDLGR